MQAEHAGSHGAAAGSRPRACARTGRTRALGGQRAHAPGERRAVRAGAARAGWRARAASVGGGSGIAVDRPAPRAQGLGRVGPRVGREDVRAHAGALHRLQQPQRALAPPSIVGSGRTRQITSPRGSRSLTTYSLAMASASPVSVVVPTFNRARLLESTLGSLVAQDPRPHVIVVDDGSTDATPAVLERFGVEVVANPPGGWGAGRARNAGLERVTTPLVAFVDSDDLLFPGALATLAAALAADAPSAPFASGWRARRLARRRGLAPRGRSSRRCAPSWRSGRLAVRAQLGPLGRRAGPGRCRARGRRV